MRTNPLRAIGVGQNSFANEVFIDELAAKQGVDPVEFRLRLLDATPLAQRARDTIEEVARMADWRRKRPGRGLGVAYLDYSGTQVAGIAEVSVDRASGAIRVHDFWCTIDVRRPRAAGQRHRADRKLDRLRAGPRAHRSASRSRTARCRQSNFFDYRVPRMRDLPRAAHQADPDAQSRRPARGRWRHRWCRRRSPTRCSALTGARLRQQPMLAERVKVALAEAGTRTA